MIYLEIQWKGEKVINGQVLRQEWFTGQYYYRHIITWLVYEKRKCIVNNYYRKCIESKEEIDY